MLTISFSSRARNAKVTLYENKKVLTTLKSGESYELDPKTMQNVTYRVGIGRSGKVPLNSQSPLRIESNPEVELVYMGLLAMMVALLFIYMKHTPAWVYGVIVVFALFYLGAKYFYGYRIRPIH
ncbi:hypothetical protein [Lactobacillus selangorensis]|uniref:hypothetical protein n=1 Tax=Lactobacillus selangorensis TaxID=81857 RepID=UPI000AEEF6B7|nr:hypothetical protein [Lactobacillus selangorensis]